MALITAPARRFGLRSTPVWLTLALFLIALWPRLAAIGRYVTPDEVIWVYRSVEFRQALLAGHWLDTLTAGHPGVTTTWLGALAITLQLILRPVDQVTYEWITHLAWYAPENVAAFSQLATFMTAGRLAVALVNSLGVVAMYLLMRPLFGQAIATLAGLLIALDPFVAGLSGLLHVDALMATFATISLLGLALTVTRNPAGESRRLGYAALSGATAALAVLSKSPALLLLPFAALFLFLSLFQNKDVPLNDRFRRLLAQGLAWLGAFLLLTLLAFPALWTSPAQVIATMSSNANRHIEEVLRPTFFMGQVRYEHGPLFYPVALAFRLNPIVFWGLILAFLLIIRYENRPEWRSPTTLLFFLWPVLFLIAISFAAKKFDRYALPAIPALTMMAAAAWIHFLDTRDRWRRIITPLLGAVAALYLLFFLPYPLSAYNLLLGGPLVAKKVMPLGWGESIGAAGRWLAAQPGAAGKMAVAGTVPALAPFFPGEARLLEEESITQADYLILTAGLKQSDPDALSRLTTGSRLIHTVRFGGLEQAWVYARPQPQKRELALPAFSAPFSFGNRIRLLAADVTVDGERVHVYVRWHRQQSDGRYTINLALVDDQGHRWAGLETALLNEVYFYPEHWAAGETPLIRYTIDLPPAIPPAEYTIALSLFDANGAQLPLLAADGFFQGVAYEAERVKVLPAALPPAVSRVNIPITARSDWLDGSLILLGHSQLQATVIAGGHLPLELYWQAQSELPDGLALALALGDKPFTFPLSRYDSGRWRPGEVIHEKLSLLLPPEMPAGHYSLSARVMAAGGEPVSGGAAGLGSVEVIAPDRLFALPPDIATPLAGRFGEGIHLRGFDLKTPAVTAGAEMRLTLYWQTEVQPDEIYTAFVHLLSPDGEVAFQADRWPGGSPSHTWAAGQVIVDEYTISVPAGTPAGDYPIAVGLYTAAGGRRLPVTDAQGRAYPDNRVILPLTLTVVTNE